MEANVARTEMWFLSTRCSGPRAEHWPWHCNGSVMQRSQDFRYTGVAFYEQTNKQKFMKLMVCLELHHYLAQPLITHYMISHCGKAKVLKAIKGKSSKLLPPTTLPVGIKQSLASLTNDCKRVADLLPSNLLCSSQQLVLHNTCDCNVTFF